MAQSLFSMAANSELNRSHRVPTRFQECAMELLSCSLGAKS